MANEPPVSHAGGNKEVMLPVGLVTLDGSLSFDDHKITEYHWVRDSNSLSAGVSDKLVVFWWILVVS